MCWTITVAADSGMLVALAITLVERSASLERAGGSLAHSGAQRSTLAGPCEVADMIPSCPFHSVDRQGLGERSREKRSSLSLSHSLSKGREDGSAWDARPFVIRHTSTRAEIFIRLILLASVTARWIQSLNRHVIGLTRDVRGKRWCRKSEEKSRGTRSTNEIVAARRDGKSSDDTMPCREQSHFD